MISFNVKRRKKKEPGNNDGLESASTISTKPKPAAFHWTPVKMSLSEAVAALPDAPTAEEYERVPVADFGRRMEVRH